MEGQRSTFAISFLVFSILGVYCARGLDLGRSSGSLETDENPSNNKNFEPSGEIPESNKENSDQVVALERRSLWKRSGRNNPGTSKMPPRAMTTPMTEAQKAQLWKENKARLDQARAMKRSKDASRAAQQVRGRQRVFKVRKQMPDYAQRVANLRESEAKAKADAERKQNESIARDAARQVDWAVQEALKNRRQ